MRVEIVCSKRECYKKPVLIRNRNNLSNIIRYASQKILFQKSKFEYNEQKF